MKALRVAAGIVNAICLLLFALYFSVQLPTFSLWFYEREFEKNGTYAQVNMEAEDLHAVTAHMIRYMRGAEDELNIETTVGGQTRLFFSEREIFHMEDVRLLFDGGRMIRNVSAMLFLLTGAFLFWQKRAGRTAALQCWRAVAFGLLGAFVVLSGIVAVSFNRAFTLFHEIFFNNDLWLLDARVDLLVNIVPTPFFIDIALFIGIVFAGILFLMGTFAAAMLRGRGDEAGIRREE